MVVPTPDTPGPSRRRRLWLAGLAVPAALAGGVAFASWWFTEPLAPSKGASPAARVETPRPSEPAPSETREWPAETLDGMAAKRLLLASLEGVRDRLARVDAYTATLRKQERLNGVLGPEQTLAMKLRHEPFAVYMKYLAPKKGKEALYAADQHDGKVIAHNGDWTRRLIPRLAVKPTDPLALADNRHPITDAGLLNLVDRLIGFRKLDLDDPEAATVLDRTVDADGRAWLRSVHTHPHPKPDRPFARIEVLYDPEGRLPLRIANYDWLAPGQGGDLPLAEQYRYDDLKLDAPLTARDFDLANPAYEFTRF